MNVSQRYANKSVKSLEGWVCSACQATQRRSARRTFKSASRVSQQDNPSAIHAAPDDIAFQSTRFTKRSHGDRLSRSIRNPSRLSQPFNEVISALNPRTQSIEQARGDDPFGVFWSLRYGKPQQIASALSKAFYDPDFLRQVPYATWSEALRRLDPRRWVVQSSLQPRDINNKGYKIAADVASFERRQLSAVVLDVVELMRQAGVPLSSSDYRLLLQYGVQLQDKSIVERFWEDMRSQGVRPDLACYNAVTESLLIATENGLKHFIEKHSDERTLSEEDEENQVSTESTNLAAQVRRIQNEMINDHGIEPNTESYCHLITAHARDGSLSQGMDVLRQVWGIDAEEIQAGHALSHLSDFRLGDPLYPTTQLLYTTADSFGYFGRMLSAFRVVDFIAQHYNIPIKQRVSNSLLYWAGHHSRNEGREWKAQFFGVPPAFLNLPQFFSTLQSQGSAELNETTIHMLLRNLQGQRATGTQEQMRLLDAGSSILASQIDRTRQMQQQLRRAQAKPPGYVSSAKPVTTLQRRVAEAYVRLDILRACMITWLSGAIEHGVPASLPLSAEHEARLTDWRLRGIPDIILRYRNLVPRQLRYQVPSGDVSIEIRAVQVVRDEVASARRAAGQLRFVWRSKPPSLPRRLKDGRNPLRWSDRKGSLLPAAQREMAPSAETG